MKITLEKYINLGGSCIDYVSSTCVPQQHFKEEFATDENKKKTFIIFFLEAGFIEFDKEVSCELAGPYITEKGTANEKHWAMFRLTDHTKEHKLPSADQIDAHQRTYIKYSAYTYGYGNCTKVFGKGWDISYVGDSRCSRGAITHQEYLQLESFLGAEKTKELYDIGLEDLDIPVDRWVNTTPHIELPIKLFVAGNDDTSFTKLFATREEAYNFLESMIKEPCKMDLNTEMLFTN